MSGLLLTHSFPKWFSLCVFVWVVYDCFSCFSGCRAWWCCPPPSFFPPCTGIEPRASHMADQYSTTKLSNTSLAAFYFWFWGGFSSFAQTGQSSLDVPLLYLNILLLQPLHSWDCRPALPALLWSGVTQESICKHPQCSNGVSRLS